VRTGAFISGGLHATAVLAVVYGLPLALQPEPPEEQPILVELVAIADKTTPQQPAPEEAKEEEAPELPPPPQAKRFAAAPPPPPAPAAKPVPETAAPRQAKLVAPPPPKPELKLKPKPKPPETKVAVAPTPKPEPKAQPEPARSDFKAMPRPSAKPTPPNRRFDASRLAALLDKSDKKPATEPLEKTARKPEAKEPAPQPAPRRTVARLTMSEIDAIRYQIQQCWSVPAGARDAENLVVRIRVFLNPDGTLARPPEIVDVGRDDSFFRTAAESARRAVLKCTPLKNLPAEKYRHWRELTLTFNPRDMLDG